MIEKILNVSFYFVFSVSFIVKKYSSLYLREKFFFFSTTKKIFTGGAK